MNALQRIIERVNRHGEFYDESTPIPLLTLDEFFNGNEISGSIGGNLPDVPHPSEMREILQKLALTAFVRARRQRAPVLWVRPVYL